MGFFIYMFVFYFKKIRNILYFLFYIIFIILQKFIFFDMVFKLKYQYTSLIFDLFSGLIQFHPPFFYISIFGFVVCNFVKYIKNIKFIINFYQFIFILFYFIALLSGGYWSFSHVVWGYWWTWDPIELILLFFIILFITLIHIIKNLFSATLPSFSILLIIFILMYSTRLGYIKSKHNFFNISLVNSLFILFYVFLFFYFSISLLINFRLNLYVYVWSNYFSIIFFVIVIIYFYLFILLFSVDLNLLYWVYAYIFISLIILYKYVSTGSKLSKHLIIGSFYIFLYNIISCPAKLITTVCTVSYITLFSINSIFFKVNHARLELFYIIFNNSKIHFRFIVKPIKIINFRLINLITNYTTITTDSSKYKKYYIKTQQQVNSSVFFNFFTCLFFKDYIYLFILVHYSIYNFYFIVFFTLVSLTLLS